jgi:hypothetical protein
MTATIHATIDKASDKVHVSSDIDKRVFAKGLATVFHVPEEDVKIVHLTETMIRSKQPKACVPSKANKFCQQIWFHFTLGFKLRDNSKHIQAQLQQETCHPSLFVQALNNAAVLVSQAANSTFVLHATQARIRTVVPEHNHHTHNRDKAPREPFADVFKVPIQADIVVKFEDPITDKLLKSDPIKTEKEMSALSRTDEAIEILTGAIAAAFGVRTDNMEVGKADVDVVQSMNIGGGLYQTVRYTMDFSLLATTDEKRRDVLGQVGKLTASNIASKVNDETDIIRTAMGVKRHMTIKSLDLKLADDADMSSNQNAEHEVMNFFSLLFSKSPCSSPKRKGCFSKKTTQMKAQHRVRSARRSSNKKWVRLAIGDEVIKVKESVASAKRKDLMAVGILALFVLQLLGLIWCSDEPRAVIADHGEWVSSF